MVGEYIPPCTWGSMRSPLVLNGFTNGASYTRYSRAWPNTENPVKFFKWDAGYLFRQVPYASPGPAVPDTTPTYWISNSELDGVVSTSFGIGARFITPRTTVDNHDFLQFVGETVDTDIGTFTITSSAHEPGGQYLGDNNPGGTEIYDIGKLTGF
jgi:hypothetical protein